ncbi:DUF6119 family protein [Actinomadura rupiterrae]|uniref:DUF6119 family protein n=1 Tax=Actinomadura rupiterrae TaxID=559627 RepID=UPI0020A30255|nr:DUF6119 family protein [Actinomadura rupiterrae]MCP2342023.1 uncharacterized protein (TIGR04141 family) [Actinomadura rupiterrae]
MTVRTLYRLLGVTSDHLEAVLREGSSYHLEFPPTPRLSGAAAALLVHGTKPRAPAAWTSWLSSVTGAVLDSHVETAADLLVLAVDGQVFAVGCGQGFRLIRDELKDSTFGLRIAARTIDPAKVRGVVRRAMAGVARLDSTLAYSGIPIGSIGLRIHEELVRKLEGQLTAADLGLPGVGTVQINGAEGLSMPLPDDPADLIDCIRTLIAISKREPREELRFIEMIQPLADRELGAVLDLMLEEQLRKGEGVDLAVPVGMLPHLDSTASYNVKIGSVVRKDRPALDLKDDVISRVRAQPLGTGVTALRDGRITMFDSAGTQLGGISAIKWLEALVRDGARHYFLVEGAWYEAGAAYLDLVHEQIQELLSGAPSLDLPPWRPGEHERDYNQRVQDEHGRARFLNLDRTSVRTALHNHNGIEVCDLYCADGVLICVKPAEGSAPLSHQFNQALVAVETLIQQADARRAFNELIAERSEGQCVPPPDGLPKKVIFAIHLKKGTDLTPDSLYPFAQIALLHMVTYLRQFVEVEVIGIPRA